MSVVVIIRRTARDLPPFDMVVANPPLIPIAPTGPFETALMDSGLQATKELVTALPRLLTKRGRCYLLTSDVIDRKDYKFDLDRLCHEHSLKVRIVAELHREYESYRIHEIKHKRTWLHKP